MLKAQSSKKNEPGVFSFLHKIIRFWSRFIDFPTALAGAVIMGLIVGVVNIGHGWWPATTAALKQAAYTFLFGGMIIRLLYAIVLSIKGKIAAIAVSVVVSSLITIIFVYLLHSLKGTPLPIESTLPTVILAPLGFYVLAWRKKKTG